MSDDYASVYDNYKPEARIKARLEPYPTMEYDNIPRCTVVTNPTRCITRVYERGLQARQPLINDQVDPFAQYPTGGYGRGGGDR
jgi:hypothetical protein